MATDRCRKSARHLPQRATVEGEEPVEIDHGDRLAFPPHEYRVRIGGHSATAKASVIALDERGDDAGQVEQISHRELNSLAAKRLGLLMDRAGAISEARDQAELVECVLEILLDGTGFGRAAILRPIDEDGRVEVIGCMGQSAETRPFSSTLIAAARRGETVRLSSEQDLSQAVSIVAGGVQSAICTPVRSGASIAGLIYLDATDSSADAVDDAAYCAAIARLHGLALGNLQRQELERRQEGFSQEIQAARSVQERIMPSPAGEVAGIRYAMHAQPGRVVAGDLFGFTEISEGRTAFFLGDVAGKGAAAGMLMAVIQASLAAYFSAGRDAGAGDRPAERIRRVANRVERIQHVVSRGDRHRNGTLCTVDAGHGYALLLRNGESSVIESDGGPPVGAVRGIPFGESQHEIQGGGSHRSLLGWRGGRAGSRLGRSSGSNGRRPRSRAAPRSSEDVERVMAALRTFAGGEAFSDDVTVASLEIIEVG